MKLWKLDLMDGSSIEMPEAAANMVKQALEGTQKFIELPDRTIAVHQIKSLDKTSKEDIDAKRTLSAGLNAFKGKLNVYQDKDGNNMISAVKVKKEVGQREFSSYYAKHPSYEVVAPQTVAFWVAKDLGVPEGCELA